MSITNKLIDENTKLLDDNQKLRYLLWLHHGCSSDLLYGDDGEMQCHNIEHGFMGIDFKRDSVELIEWKLMNALAKQTIKRPKK
jgi:hypothetical protein